MGKLMLLVRYLSDMYVKRENAHYFMLTNNCYNFHEFYNIPGQMPNLRYQLGSGLMERLQTSR